MSEPQYTQFTERMYARLPEVMREADALSGYALKRYISAVGDVQDQVERLIARFTYLSKQDRLGLDHLADDHSYYDLDWRYFQSTDSKNSAMISSDAPAFLRTQDTYRVVPNTIVYAGAVFRTDSMDPTSAHGLRLWYYDAAMVSLTFRDVATGNGGRGPQWWALNATDAVPSEAYYIRVSPWSKPVSGTVRVWVDDVYVRSHYEVTSTNNLVSDDHNFILRSEDEMMEQGDFDLAVEAQWEADRLRAEAMAWPDIAPNLIANGSFELDTPAWLRIAGRYGVSEHEGARTGSRVMRLSPVSANAYPMSELFAVQVGQQIHVQVWYRYFPNDRASRLGVYYETYGSDGVRIGGGMAQDQDGNRAYLYPDDMVEGEWALFTGTVPVTEAGATGLRVGPHALSPSTDLFHIDDFHCIDITPGLDLEAQADIAQERADLAAWDLGPEVNLADHALDHVPDIQSYRTWLSLDSDTAEPAYARQIVDEVISNATYTVSTLMVKDASVPDTAEVRVTVTPDTGGPTVQTFMMSDYETNRPTLLSFVWNSPEQVSTAIVNIEYVADAPARGMRINDVSMTRYQPSLAQMGRDGEPTTLSVQEKVSQELLAGAQPRGEGWTRYETGTDPEVPLDPSAPDPASGTSFIEDGWHQTRPGNRYNLRGEYRSSGAGAYADVIIWYRIEGKGWGEAVLHRIASDTLHAWVSFDREIVIPDSATEFRVNIDVYRPDGTKTYDLRNLSLTSPVDRSWWVAGSRPFAFNALTTRNLNFLSRGDLVHYTAKVLVTGDLSGGRGGVRVYSNGSQVVHETLIQSVETNTLLQVTGAFQVSESLADLRVALYMNDPTPRHQAAYFLSDLEVVHSIQQYVEDPQSMVRNGGFEFTNALEGWNLLTERETVRKNLIPNPVGTVTTDMDGWSGTDERALVTVEGRPAIRMLELGTATSFYIYANEKLSPPVGSTITMSVDVMVTHETTVPVRLVFGAYQGAMLTNRIGPTTLQSPSDGFVRHTLSCVVTDMPEGGFLYAMVYPPAVDSNPFAVGQGLYIRDYLVEVNTYGPFFDRYTPDTVLSTHSWDGEAHVARTLAYEPPAALPMFVSTDTGYSREDVPDRPSDAPLGSTSDLVDPRTANTEWLPWLSQFAGHSINHFSSLEEARNAFSDTESNFAAGTIGAIQNAVGAVLTGTRTVRVFPMTTRLDQVGQASQWDVAIVTRTSESPDISVMEEAVRLRNAKPVGVVFHFFKHQSTWDAVELANPDWNTWDERNWIQIEEAGLAEG